MELSICVVSWNVKEHLERCLRSVVESSGPEDETIVVDNASRDGSADMVSSLFPSVRLIRSGRNIGFAAGANLALTAARGRYLLLLNPDTIVQPGAFREMVSFLDRCLRAGAAGCRLLEPDGRIQPSVRSFPTYATALERFTILGRLHLLPGVRRRYFRAGFDYGTAGEVDQVMGAALFLRRTALDEVGPLDERFYLYFEEVDLCRRLRSAGWSICYNPAASIVHLGGASFDQVAGQARLRLLNSQLEYLKKHRSRTGASLFTVLFKTLVVPGEAAGLAAAGFELAAAFFGRADRNRIESKKNRWRRKREFFFRHLPRFVLSGNSSP